jgi:DNA-binding MarR family transcriptional regulator
LSGRFEDRYIERVAAFRIALREFLWRAELSSHECGITPRQYLLLLFVKGAPRAGEAVTFSELARMLRLSNNTVTGLVDRAAAAGLVRRRRSETDNRVIFIDLTPLGEEKLECALAASEADRTEFARAFAGVADAFGGTRRRRPK